MGKIWISHSSRSGNGEEALEKIEKSHPDVLLTVLRCLSWMD